MLLSSPKVRLIITFINKILSQQLTHDRSHISVKRKNLRPVTLITKKCLKYRFVQSDPTM